MFDVAELSTRSDRFICGSACRFLSALPPLAFRGGSLAASKAIRQFELEVASASNRAPIVACTAATILDGEVDLQHLGIDAVLAKPITIDAMSACLGRW
jgi:CheY-like chemotaxis protein